MSTDVYQPCPCGSGKKLKFCCLNIVAEMDRVIRLEENNQFHMALQALDRLDEQHADRPWVKIGRASILLHDDRPDEAKQVLAVLLEKYPDHPFAIALHGAASFAASDLQSAKPDLHRAFERCTADFPHVIGGLAQGMAASLFEDGKFMACREHLALAMRLVADHDRQTVFMRLLEFDGSAGIPYPLRSVHQPTDYVPRDDCAADAAEAARLSDMGCWSAAADLYERMTERDPESAALWENLGFCRAWDGDEIRASVALHRAARLQDDDDTAVECETIAQLLELNSTEDRTETVSLSFSVASVSNLLTRLDEAERLARVPSPVADDGSFEEIPAAIYDVIDRPAVADSDVETLTRETVPNSLAQVTVYDENPDGDEPPLAYLTAMYGKPLDESLAMFEAAAGDLAEPVEDDDDDSPIDSMARELVPLGWRWHFPPRIPARLRQQLENQQWEHVATEVWPQLPLSGLGGKTPQAAAGDDQWKVPLTAAVYVLDAICEKSRHALDVDRVFQAVRLEPPQPIAVSDATPLNAFSPMRLNRLPVADLSDAQLSYTLNRAMLVHHTNFLYRVLSEVLQRPACRENVDLNRTYMTLMEIARRRGGRDEAFGWLEKGRQEAATGEKQFEDSLTWALREMSMRLEDPNDPELNPLLKRLYEYYGAKVPELREQLVALVDAHGLEPPWSAVEAVAVPEAESGSVTDGGIWTPTGAAAEPAGKKLWLPGRE